MPASRTAQPERRTKKLLRENEDWIPHPLFFFSFLQTNQIQQPKTLFLFHVRVLNLRFLLLFLTVNLKPARMTNQLIRVLVTHSSFFLLRMRARSGAIQSRTRDAIKEEVVFIAITIKKVSLLVLLLVRTRPNIFQFLGLEVIVDRRFWVV